MRTVISHSLEETQKIAKEWLMEISAGAKNDTAINESKELGAVKTIGATNAFAVGLIGHLGAGKTTFVKAVAKELGIKETVTSPTFVIMKIYDIDQKAAVEAIGANNFNWKRLVHIDAYRFEKPEELKALNLERLMADKDNLIMIEWPENVGLKLENEIKFKALEEGTIEIEF